MLLKNYHIIKNAHKQFNISYFKLILSYLLKKNINTTLFNKKISISPSRLLQLSRLLENNWKILSLSQEYIKLKYIDNTIITCRLKRGYDLGHLVEIFLDNSYGDNFDGKNIIDIGMSNADSSIYFAKHGAKYVVGLEPDKQSFDLALRNINDSGVNKKVLPLNKALSKSGKKIEFVVYYNNPNANSISKKNMVKINNDGIYKEMVDSITLKEVINKFKYKGKKVNLLKMDCEGCEYDVLENLDSDSYSKIDAIILEYHNGLQKLPNILKKNGFKLEIFENTDKMGYIKAKK